MSDRYYLLATLKRRGITQQEIARAAHCRHQNVSQFISGQHSSLKVAAVISQLTGISVERLLNQEAA